MVKKKTSERFDVPSTYPREKIGIRKGKDEDMAKVGIHLINPSEMDVENAMQDASKHGFETIWVHNKHPMRKLKKVI